MPGRTLRCDVHAYKTGYNKVLEQVITRHNMYEKLAEIMSTPDVAESEYEHKMNKWDDELKNFMLGAEERCRTYKTGDLE